MANKQEIPKTVLSDSGQVMMEIKNLEQQIYQGGNVDVEKDQINQIMTELNLHKISPDEALLRLKNLEGGRQDYH